jgi:hypothetical protein
MARRGITVEEVDEALVNRETSYAGCPADRIVVLGRTRTGRRLKSRPRTERRGDGRRPG